MDEWTEKMRYNRYKGMFLSLYEKRINATCSTTDGSRDYLSEKSQTEKAKYPGTSLISVIDKRILAMNTLRKHSQAHRLTDCTSACHGGISGGRETMEQVTDSPRSYI